LSNLRRFSLRHVPGFLLRQNLPGGARCEICRAVLIASLGSLLLIELLVLVPSYKSHVARQRAQVVADGRHALETIRFGLQLIDADDLDEEFLAPLLSRQAIKGTVITNGSGAIVRKSGGLSYRSLPDWEFLDACCEAGQVKTSHRDKTIFLGTKLPAINQAVQLIVVMDGSQVTQNAYRYLAKQMGLIALICLGVTAAVVTVMGRYANEVEYKAYHDLVTGLPNQRHMAESVAQLQREQNIFALVVFEIDDFRSIRERWGQHQTREMLNELGAALTRQLPPVATLGKYKFAAFSVLVRDYPDRTALNNIIQTIQYVLAHELVIKGDQVNLTACIGVYESENNSQRQTVDSLELADLSLTSAVREGANQVVFYEEELRRLRDERIFVVTRLRSALTRNQLSLAYQLQYNAASSQPAGAEALMRWTHPRLGNISPAVFIPLAEESGTIIEYGTWALQQAAAQFARWRTEGILIPRISVNLSPKQFMDPQLVETVSTIVSTYNMAPGELELEITESAIISRPDLARARMEELRELGIQFAIDDFGTGHSTLSNLGIFPFSRLKIDQSFVRNIQQSSASRVIVKSCIELAHGLGMDVVAEGVEESAEFEILAEWNCDVIQGYLFSRPQTPQAIAAELAALAQKHSKAA